MPARKSESNDSERRHLLAQIKGWKATLKLAENNMAEAALLLERALLDRKHAWVELAHARDNLDRFKPLRKADEAMLRRAVYGVTPGGKPLRVHADNKTALRLERLGFVVVEDRDDHGDCLVTATKAGRAKCAERKTHAGPSS